MQAQTFERNKFTMKSLFDSRRYFFLLHPRNAVEIKSLSLNGCEEKRDFDDLWRLAKI